MRLRWRKRVQVPVEVLRDRLVLHHIKGDLLRLAMYLIQGDLLHLVMYLIQRDLLVVFQQSQELKH